jgi:ketosteroid isomerase-like protein
MSQDNVERLRGFLEHTFVDIPALVESWERGEADLSIFDDEIVYQDSNLPDHVGETYRGLDGLLRAAKRWVEPFEILRVELEEIVGTGDLLVSVHEARAKAKDVEIELRDPLSYVWTFRDGRVTHFRSIRDRAEALEAAGLLDRDRHSSR